MLLTPLILSLLVAMLPADTPGGPFSDPTTVTASDTPGGPF